MKDGVDFENQIDNIRNRIWLFNVLAWISVVSGLIILFVGLNFLFIAEKDFNEVGDFVGGVAGSLWALAGLFFIYIAFLGQKIEIKYQQEDLKLTRDELKETKEVFKQQAIIMSNQQLDNTFFNLLDNHRKLIESFSSNPFDLYDRQKGTGYKNIEVNCKSWKTLFSKFSKMQEDKIVWEQSDFKFIPRDINSVETGIGLLFDEINHIINFINEKNNKDLSDFHFKTLTNNLKEEEKWLYDAYAHVKNPESKKTFEAFSSATYNSNLLNIFDPIQINYEFEDFELEHFKIEYSIMNLLNSLNIKSQLLIIENGSISFNSGYHILGKNPTIDIVRNFGLIDIILSNKSLKGANVVLIVVKDDFKYLFNYKVDVRKISNFYILKFRKENQYEEHHKNILKTFLTES